MLNDKIGKSIYFTHLFTEMLKTQEEGKEFKELLDVDHPSFNKIKREFENRLNKLYTHPLLGDQLDSGEIDFCVLNLLEELHRFFSDGHHALDPYKNY